MTVNAAKKARFITDDRSLESSSVTIGPLLRSMDIVLIIAYSAADFNGFVKNFRVFEKSFREERKMKSRRCRGEILKRLSSDGIFVKDGLFMG